MIRVEITPDIITRGRLFLPDPDATIKNNLKFGYDSERILRGYIGEIIIGDYLVGSERINDYDYDLLYKGLKLEVKTVTRTSKPELSYDFSITSRVKQNADYYMCVWLLKDLSAAYMLGYMKCEDFYAQSKLIEAGTIINNNKTMSDQRVIKISELKNFKKRENND
jgi:hypothetical protein